MCVPEACDVRIVIAAILKEKSILLFGVPGRIQRMRVKGLYSKFESVGTPAHINVQVRLSGLSRAAWQAA